MADLAGVDGENIEQGLEPERVEAASFQMDGGYE
jgi:hypothetical protein